jgi:ribonuclease P protein component
VTDSRFVKNSRLLSVADFENLKIDSSVFKKQSLIVYYKKNSLGHSRLGLSVSKKVGNSPTRNRFKRILREYYRKSEVIKSLEFDILLVVSFTRSLADASQDKKENVLTSNVQDFYNMLTTTK